MKDKELVKRLVDMGHDGTVILENPSFDESILGVTEDGQLVYSYDKMIMELSRADNISPEEAQEFIDYNTIRAIPYMGEKKPIVVHSIDD